MDQWLIRTSQNLVAGPYTREQVCQLIRDGQLGLQDEFCAANGYWIYVHEREEVKRVLGVDVPRGAPTDDEITETQTVRPPPGSPASAGFSSDFGGDDGAPDTTAVLNSELMRKMRPGGAAETPPAGTVVPPPSSPAPTPAAAGQPAVSIAGAGMERSAFVRGFAWVLALGVLLVIYLVFKLTRN
jgi:hypothetical protein